MKENDEKSAKIAIIHVACFSLSFFVVVVGWLFVCFSFLLLFFFFDDLTACERDERSARE